jgi:hypothetical protein
MMYNYIMKDITLYLDMDGVLANFNKRFAEIQSHLPDHQKFRDAVMIHKIFEDLEFMPDAQQLLNHVSRLNGINIEILTSMGTFDPQRGEAAKFQKLHWLNKKNIPYRANFVRTKTEKAQYANDHAILIDDSIGCITPFIEKMGHGILHVNAPDSIRILDSTILQIRALDALNYA